MRRGFVAVLAAAGLCTVASAREDVKRDFRKSANLAVGRSMRIESQFGRINVRPQPGREVSVQAAIHCSADTMDQAKRICDQIQVVFEESAAGVSLRTVYPQLHGSFRNLSYAVDYDITMPDSAPLDVRNRFGTLAIWDLHAATNINSGNGAVFLYNGRGALRIENSFGMVEVRKNEGDVTIQNSNGPTIAADVTGTLEIGNRFGEIRVMNAGKGVTIRSNNSNIQVEGAGGPVWISNSFGRTAISDVRSNVTVQSQNGDIDANRIGGAAELHTSFAAIRFSRIEKGLTVRANNVTVRGETVGEAANVETTFGGVDLRDVRGGARVSCGNTYIKLTGIGGEVYAKTTFGSVNVADAAGPITVEGQNGAVTVAPRAGRCQPMSLRTTFSPIRVTVPQGQGYNVTAQTTFGQIHSDPAVVMTVSGTLAQNAVVGKINGGGCEMKLTGQNSSIDILR